MPPELNPSLTAPVEAEVQALSQSREIAAGPCRPVEKDLEPSVHPVERVSVSREIIPP